MSISKGLQKKIFNTIRMPDLDNLPEGCEEDTRPLCVIIKLEDYIDLIVRASYLDGFSDGHVEAVVQLSEKSND